MDGQNSVLSVVGPLATSIPSLRLLMKALLAQNPWHHDPMVHEIPWRYEQEREILELTGSIGDASKASKLAFGVMKTDGIVNPTPPVRRAVDITVKALQELGHEVVDWSPPSHKVLLDEGMKALLFDGGVDLRKDFALSGEDVADQVKFFAGDQNAEFKGSEIFASNIKMRDLKKQYLDYWNSTVEKTSTGRPVDALICPLAPFPAARPKTFTYYGYSTFVNLLDYTAVVVPVTNVDKGADGVDKGYEPLDEVDRSVFESCKS
jgi:amidase